MKRRRVKPKQPTQGLGDLLETLILRINELEGLYRCVEGELETLHELIKKFEKKS